MEKIILVTGGNRGIGHEICRQLAEKGATILLTARTLEKAEKAAKKIQGSVIPLALDVTDDHSIQEAAEFIHKKYEHLDVLINNAGIGVGKSSLSDPNIEEIKHIMNTNFYGPIHVNKAFIPLLKQSTEGRIINMGSAMGAFYEMGPGYAGYRLSKTGLHAQTVILAQELKPANIKVDAICPGWVRTHMGGPNAPRNISQGADTAVWLATVEHIATGKLYRDREVIEW